MSNYSTTFALTENPISESGAWTSGPGLTDAIQTTGGVARGAAAGTVYDNIARLLTPSIGGPQFSESIIGTVSGGTLGVQVRMPSATEADGYVFYADGTVPNYSYYRMDDDGATIVFTQLGSNITGTPANGTVLRLEANGSTLTGYINGTPQTAQSDSTYSTGQPAFSAHHPTTIANATVASWQGGDLVSNVNNLAMMPSRQLIMWP